MSGTLRVLVRRMLHYQTYKRLVGVRSESKALRDIKDTSAMIESITVGYQIAVGQLTMRDLFLFIFELVFHCS